MGQYQQWLQYRETEHLLEERLRQLEDELARLEASPPNQEQNGSLSGNTILVALAATMQQQKLASAIAAEISALAYEQPASAPSEIVLPTQAEAEPAEEGEFAIAPEAISPALQAWSRLPDFNGTAEPNGMAETVFPFPSHDPQLPPIPHAEIDLLPEDMNAFFDQHTQTDPQMELPWWLRPIAAMPGAEYPGGPVDPQSVRTNRLVQRWIERWGRETPPPYTPGE